MSETTQFGPPMVSKPVHMAKLIAEDGSVSPLCAKRPRKLKLDRETWCLRPQDVTCAACQKQNPQKLEVIHHAGE